MMEVVEVCGLSRSAGGLFYAVTPMCRELYAQEVGLRIYGRYDPFVVEDRAGWGGIPTWTYKGYGPLGISFGLRSKLESDPPDLVHQHGIWLADQGTVLHWQRRGERAVVVSPHGMLDPWALRNSAWKKKLAGMLFANKALRQATCIHALCRSEVESIRAYGLSNPVALVPNAVELPVLNQREPSGAERSLLFLGRLHPKKGVAELLKAWPGFNGGWKLVVAGWDDGGHEAGLRELAVELGVEGQVEFVGATFGEAKERLFRNVDAFVLPSFSEGLPMSVLEAWSYGLPVVMTEFCNLPEGFDAGAAIRVKPNAESIGVGLEMLASMNDQDLSAMGAAGRALVEEKFTWPKVAADMRRVYEWCIGGGQPPECMEFADG